MNSHGFRPEFASIRPTSERNSNYPEGVCLNNLVADHKNDTTLFQVHASESMAEEDWQSCKTSIGCDLAFDRTSSTVDSWRHMCSSGLSKWICCTDLIVCSTRRLITQAPKAPSLCFRSSA
ncbi:hypothetical protein [Echinococcus multilocularis]|uniref:Uncharacterized protein n=1 Tax=Echinococcus multilocularis TaxID=6211 RepID=A0A068Y9H0_ECHMU|nr:hypothetical protein [Echinococcus multilocularis]